MEESGLDWVDENASAKSCEPKAATTLLTLNGQNLNHLIHRRRLLMAAIAALFGSTIRAPGKVARGAGGACKKAQSSIGAIRWDAWYDPDSVPGKAVEASLGPERYHFRLPFFATVEQNGRVKIDGNHQNVMDREVDFAVQAGITYWAFVAYSPADSMSNALRLYLASAQKRRMNFCMLSELNKWASQDVVAWHIALMREPSYQKVLNDRPLYFIGFFDDATIRKFWGSLSGLRQFVDMFRVSIQKSGLNNPYIVMLDQDAAVAARYAKAVGLDAVGAYAVNRNLRAAPFSELSHEAEQLWSADESTGLSTVPIVTTGFDQRPRFEHPPPWANGSMDIPTALQFYYETAKPEEIAKELRDCLAWMAANRSAAPAQIALVYAWNENDEGGWLIPTFPNDTSRITTMAHSLCGN
jgi:hypothetical protein